MKKIYFSGSIRGGRNDSKYYLEIIKLVQDRGDTVLTEHIGDKELSHLGEADRTEDYIYKRDMAWVTESDAVIAEVSTPSLGVGYEIAYAETMNKPVLALYRPQAGKKLSGMIVGSPKTQVVEYHDVRELKDKIDSFLEGL